MFKVETFSKTLGSNNCAHHILIVGQVYLEILQMALVVELVGKVDGGLLRPIK